LTVLQNLPDLSGGQGLHNEVRYFAVELLAQNWRVPVEVTRQSLDDLRVRQHARVIAEDGSQRSCVV
jgi:hypothetical protein